MAITLIETYQNNFCLSCKILIFEGWVSTPFWITPSNCTSRFRPSNIRTFISVFVFVSNKYVVNRMFMPACLLVTQMFCTHYNDVRMGAMTSQITSLTIVYSTVYSGADQSKHQSSASLAFVWGSHRGPVNSPHNWPVTRKMLPFDDVIMRYFDLSTTWFRQNR